ncbi:phosphatase PAP2 family protein [Saprospiraceae bacterium]|nr:phosphatase PAP2 family protein [Saprospiraceae bacterium]
MSNTTSINRLSKNWVIPFAVISVLYWLWFGLVAGITNIEIGFYLLMCFFAFFNKTTRRLFLSFSPLFIYLIGYSSLRLLHQDGSETIHNQGLYNLELKLFGFEYMGKTIIPCEYFAENHNAFLDFIAGFFYVSWMPFPILFGFIAFFTFREKLAFQFWLAFLFTNLLGFTGYILFPAAPPWYYLTYGAEIMNNAPSSAAGLLRFDELINFPLYHGMYKSATNTFGAMPSMHAAFPMVLTYYAIKYGNKVLTTLFAISLAAIWFGAIYSNHHYILDVIAGICCAIIGILLSEIMVNRTFAPNWYKRTMLYIQSNQKK